MNSTYFFKSLIPTYKSYAQNGRVVAFDTETTGLSSDDEIVQLSAVEYINGHQSRVFSFYLKPSKALSTDAAEVNGLTNEFLNENGHDPKEVLEQFVDFIGNDCLLVAHNIQFDLRMLNQGFSKYGVEGSGNKVLGCDTRNFVKEMKFSGISNHRLSTCVEYFALDALNSHEALDDADACGKLFFKLVGVELK